jgi:hypothetical protein
MASFMRSLYKINPYLNYHQIKKWGCRRIIPLLGEFERATPPQGANHRLLAKVKVHRYADGSLGVFHGPRKLASYTAEGKVIDELAQAA